MMTLNISSGVTTTDNISDEYSLPCRSGYIDISPDMILALVLSGLAISLNIITLLAISRIKNRITTHHRLIISLCVSDALIGVSVCMHNVYLIVSPYNKYSSANCKLASMCLFISTKALNSTGLIAGLLNLMMMAADHFIAIIRPLHYPLQMRTSRSTSVILVLWIVSILLGFSDLFTGYNIYYTDFNYNYCEAVYFSLYTEEYTVFVTAALTLIIMFYIYIRIYIKIKRHRTPGERQPGTAVKTTNSFRRRHSNISRNKRALITTLLIIGTFMICWMPTCIFEIAMVVQIHINLEPLEKHSSFLIALTRYLYDLLILNSIADPIIYAVRMYDVQLGYKRLINKCFPCFKIDDTCHNTNSWERNLSKKACHVPVYSKREVSEANKDSASSEKVKEQMQQINPVKYEMNGNINHNNGKDCSYLIRKGDNSDDNGRLSDISQPYTADF